MKVLGYKGISLVSKLIRWQTRSEYSHAAVELSDGSVIEAWHRGGVCHVDDFREQHEPGTKVDVFTFDHDGFDEKAAINFLLNQVGKKYDRKSILRFVTRRMDPANDRWICSELVEAGLRAGQKLVLRGPPSTHSPRDTFLSPIFVWEEERTV